jgi:hypothetical protein
LSKTKEESGTIMAMKFNPSEHFAGLTGHRKLVIASTPWPHFRITRSNFNISMPRAHPRPITSESLRFQSRCQNCLKLPERFYCAAKIENYLTSKASNEV